MAAVVLAGAGAVHFFVVLCHKNAAAVRVAPYPVLERIPDCLLLLGGEGGFLGVENAALLAVRVLHGVVNADVSEV